MAIACILPVARYRAEAWLDSIMHVLQDGLSHMKRTHGQTEALLTLIGGCAAAFGPAIENTLAISLDDMFSDGLSPALVKAVEAIALNIPGLAYIVRVCLLDCISMIITGTSFQDFAMPASSARRASVASLRDPRPSHGRRRSTSLFDRARARSISPMRDNKSNAKGEGVEQFNSATQVEALYYLGTIDFGEQPLLLGYFQEHILPILSSADLEVRRAALHACCHFLTRCSAADSLQLSSAIRNLLHAITLLGVVDENAALRAEALKALDDARFDKYLVSNLVLLGWQTFPIDAAQ